MLSCCDLLRSAVDFLRSSCCGTDKYSYYKEINHSLQQWAALRRKTCSEVSSNYPSTTAGIWCLFSFVAWERNCLCCLYITAFDDAANELSSFVSTLLKIIVPVCLSKLDTLHAVVKLSYL